MLEQLQTLTWFLRRPLFWPHMAALARQRLSNADRHEQHVEGATQWAADRAIPIDAALRRLGALGAQAQLHPPLDPSLLREAEARAATSKVAMGGPGDLELIYQAILATRARRVVETGVAYGWSSLAALAALEKTDGQLASVDMPYPKAGNEPFVGIAVPDRLRSRWTLIREPDRNGIRRALAHFNGVVDLAHFDSDKSYDGRLYAYALLWRALSPGGLLISDDIQDNFGFRDFCAQNAVEAVVTQSGGKFVGVLKKPDKA